MWIFYENVQQDNAFHCNSMQCTSRFPTPFANLYSCISHTRSHNFPIKRKWAIYLPWNQWESTIKSVANFPFYLQRSKFFFFARVLCVCFNFFHFPFLQRMHSFRIILAICFVLIICPFFLLSKDHLSAMLDLWPTSLRPSSRLWSTFYEWLNEDERGKNSDILPFCLKSSAAVNLCACLYYLALTLHYFTAL